MQKMLEEARLEREREGWQEMAQKAVFNLVL